MPDYQSIIDNLFLNKKTSIYIVKTYNKVYLINTIVRYETEDECEGSEACEKGQWFTTGWSDCSATECEEEGGLKKRKVLCW